MRRRARPLRRRGRRDPLRRHDHRGDEHEEITDVPDRSRIRRGQTPQAFRLSTIRRAYELAWQDPDFTATDDCSVVLRYLPDVPIGVVHGSEQNMKVTHPIDIFLADKLFQLASSAPPPADPDGLPDGAGRQERRRARRQLRHRRRHRRRSSPASAAPPTPSAGHRPARTSSDAEDVEAALRTAFEASGRIDYVIVTAGVLRRGPLVDTPIEEIEETIRVNYMAPVVAARAALPYLQETKGQLMLFTSSSYTRGRADYSIYSSTKAAVVNLTQALADEWAPLGVRVNCVNPERTSRPMRTKAFGAEPEGSLLSSKAVALTSIDVLLSDLTGHVIDVRRVEPGDARHVPHRARGQPDRRGAGRGGVRPGRPRRRLSARWPERRGSC